MESEALPHAKFSRRARQAAVRLCEAGKLEAAYRRVRELEARLAQIHVCRNPGVRARLEAVALAFAAQERAAEAGQPSRSSVGLISRDEQTLYNAAKHNFTEDFESLTPTKARRSLRGVRKARGSKHAALHGGSSSDPGTLLEMGHSTDDWDDCEASSDHGLPEFSSFHKRFNEALGIINYTLALEQHGSTHAPGIWLGTGISADMQSKLNPSAAPFIPRVNWDDHEAATHHRHCAGVNACEATWIEPLPKDNTLCNLPRVETTAGCTDPAVDARDHELPIECKLTMLHNLSDKIDDLNEANASRFNALVNRGISSDQAIARSLDKQSESVQAVFHGLSQQFSALLAEIKHLTERDNLQGLPQILLDIASRLKHLDAHKEASSARDAAQKTAEVSTQTSSDQGASLKTFADICIQCDACDKADACTGAQLWVAPLLTDTSTTSDAIMLSVPHVSPPGDDKQLLTTSKTRWIDIASDEEPWDESASQGSNDFYACEKGSRNAALDVPTKAPALRSGRDAREKAESCNIVVYERGTVNDCSPVIACDKAVSCIHEEPLRAEDDQWTASSQDPGNASVKDSQSSCAHEATLAQLELNGSPSGIHQVECKAGDVLDDHAYLEAIHVYGTEWVATARACCINPSDALLSVPDYPKLAQFWPPLGASLRVQALTGLSEAVRELEPNAHKLYHYCLLTAILLLQTASVSIPKSLIDDLTSMIKHEAHQQAVQHTAHIRCGTILN
eukprot:TRINITY_DN23824_c0_g2_i1.p1 TRINITY_DN23824_c0_g2~~TRINITY_DN23824_c0_g2_i1.p1  ORF type:complete len:737 (-),score=118.68 TRINITY_DN23824_c0_g2_i1:69-2279(-)